jgi:hypothetical protein
MIPFIKACSSRLLTCEDPTSPNTKVLAHKDDHSTTLAPMDPNSKELKCKEIYFKEACTDPHQEATMSNKRAEERKSDFSAGDFQIGELPHNSTLFSPIL